ncbi:kinase-regulated stress-responsive transcription factor skn7 [Apophysomyces ossiformis]|uniref:Transcription factor n=1 Tax=Apophysomyces ossiformis TaxID=679940 RepID=A0A8H7BYT9_9FUNG|nr:kinase-regulated stress-responsive transcription factor skn7 [Apophysomyces ossiformis]
MDQHNLKGYSPPSTWNSKHDNTDGNPKLNNTKKSVSKTSTKNNEGAGSVPEFIQKLFRMLENKSFRNTFCWGPTGKTFIVKDTNEFSKTILPKHFKHCNFASFVRQLNKYDFHKVRNADDGHKTYGDQAWEFVHPNFMRDRKDLLEAIRRKTPGKQKKEESTSVELESSPSVSQNDRTQQRTSNDFAVEEIRRTVAKLNAQIEQLQKSRIEMESNMQKMSQTDEIVLAELYNLNKNMAARDALIQDFLKIAVQREREVQQVRMVSATSTELAAPTMSMESPSQAQKLLDAYSEIALTTSEHLATISKQLQKPRSTRPSMDDTGTEQQVKEEPAPQLSYADNDKQSKFQQQPADQPTLSAVPASLNDPDTATAAAAAASMNAGSLIGSPLKTMDGLTFVTLGRVSPNVSLRDNKPAIELTMAPGSSNLNPNMEQRTSEGVAGIKRKSTALSWTVPPRILLVDDDSVYRDLSGRLLQLIGCRIDLAKDGMEAIRKMGLEKYDLILMDIVMPNLDGIAATRNIRQYDALTPIISMTSNFTQNDIMQYIGIGMTDILPKPFSKRTLYSMLEKYCAHLKAIQRVQGSDQTSVVHRSLGDFNLLPTPPSTEVGEGSSHTPASTASYSSAPAVTTPAVSPAFPYPSYPFPVTMNTITTNMGNPYTVAAPANDVTNVTFWSQQQRPIASTAVAPAIIPSNDGKFMWAAPEIITAEGSYEEERSSKRQKTNAPSDE